MLKPSNPNTDSFGIIDEITTTGGEYKPPTPFAYFILPWSNKKIVVQENRPPYEKMKPNWQTAKEFNPR